MDSLKDIHDQLQNLSLSLGRLYILQGNPVEIFRRLHEICGIKKLCFEQDCEPIWNRRDNSVKKLCHDLGITCIERISHTLWDPKKVIDTNGGIPPLTYQMFLVSRKKYMKLRILHYIFVSNSIQYKLLVYHRDQYPIPIGKM